jgi:hypothetical protein
MKKLLICKNVCPVVKALRDENEALKARLSFAEDALELNGRLLDRAYDSVQKREVRINQLIQSKREDERRIAKARQALFGVLDQPKIVGGP